MLGRDTKSSIPDEYKKLIWFLYPQEVARELKKFNEKEVTFHRLVEMTEKHL